jgi:hypothetical protein
LAAYTLVGIPYYEWYLAPVYPIVGILVGAGLASLWPLLRIGAIRPPALSRATQGLFFVAILAAIVPGQRSIALASSAGFKLYLENLEAARFEAGRWLRAHTPADTKVYTGFVGHVGFESQRYIIDGSNLITPGGIGRQGEADFHVMEGLVREGSECGPIADFSSGTSESEFGRVVISRCAGEAYARLGSVRLDMARISNWVRDPDGRWAARDLPYLETQWLTDEPLSATFPSEPWTLYVHFVNANGETVAQMDHRLGQQINGSIDWPSTWAKDERAYTYTELPDEWADVADDVVELRIGLWNPATGIHAEAQAMGAQVDKFGRVIVPLSDLLSGPLP